MTDQEWRPFSIREGLSTDDRDVLHEDVPEWLEPSLRGWLREVFSELGEYLDLHALAQKLERVLRVPLKSEVFVDDASEIEVDEFIDGIGRQDAYLDVVDFVLGGLVDADYLDDGETAPEAEATVSAETSAESSAESNESPESAWVDPKWVAARVAELKTILDDAGSLWTPVTARADGHLERRVLETSGRLARRAMNSDDAASEHLAAAWSDVYGRTPDPSDAYSRAVKAVEAAAHPVVLPNDSTATLGKMIKALRDKPSKWVVLLEHPEPDMQVLDVAGMMNLLWKGQFESTWNRRRSATGCDDSGRERGGGPPRCNARAVVSLRRSERGEHWDPGTLSRVIGRLPATAR